MLRFKAIVRKANQTGGLMFTLPGAEREAAHLDDGDFVEVTLAFNRQPPVKFTARVRAAGARRSMRVTLPTEVAREQGITDGVAISVRLEPLILVPRSLLDGPTLSRLGLE